MLSATLFLHSLPSLALAQNPGRIDEAGVWPLETVTLHDGSQYRGYVQSQNSEEWEIVDVVQPQGQPMYMIVRPIAPNRIARYDALDEEGRAILADRIDAFRHRSRIEAGRMERVELENGIWQDVEFRRYTGSWFTLYSATEDELTRRCVVRVMQIFRAYHQILPPLTEPNTELQIVLFGSIDAYGGLLRDFNLEIDNLAFYAPGENLIVAGSDLDTFAQQLQSTRARNDRVREHYNRLDAEMHNRLVALAQELLTHGYSDREISREIANRRRAWRVEYHAKIRELAEARRRNEAHFFEISDQMFNRLYHEALHAYIENFLFPREQGSLPPWLNEGLAQLFEGGFLEADILRFDAPLPTALAHLQDDLRSDNPLPLERLLVATQNDFLFTDHEQGASSVAYAHAWGLVYYLTHTLHRLSTESMAEYVGNAEEDPLQHFEQFVGMPLEQFEQQWHAAMLAMEPAGR